MLFSRLVYYFTSLPTLFLGIQNWWTMARIFLGIAVPNPVIIELRDGSRFRIRTRMDVWVMKEACLDHQNEKFSTLIQDGWTILDIGAGIGDFAISIARTHPQSIVHAFEPFPESFALLQENLNLNDVTNVRASPRAVGAENGTLELRAVSAQAVQQSTAAQHGTSAIRVPSITLDQLFADLNLARCDYLKMDCEGAEYGILFNASQDTLGKISHLCLEYHDGVTSYSHIDLARFLEQHGFKVTSQVNPAHHDLGLMYAKKS
jgi:FkbM family methyltransferase